MGKKKIENAEAPEKLTGTVKNAWDMQVNVCCGSCAFKQIEGLTPPKRMCTKHGSEVDVFDSCDEWQMSAPMKRVGKKQGNVKCKLYLNFVLRARIVEMKAIEEGRMKVCQQKSVQNLREQFKEFFRQSPFIHLEKKNSCK